MSKPILYSIEASPPVRAVRLTAEAIGLELEIKNVDLFAGEHLKESFLKINPQHTVPTLDDNGTILWDSHAICTYLVGKYAKNDSLYPKDLVTRARIDQRLHFDSGVLYPVCRAANMVVYFSGPVVPQEKIDALYAALDLLETFLKEDKYLVGNSLTLADLCAAPTVTSFELHIPIEKLKEKYPSICAWIDRLKQLPYFEALDTKPMDAFKIYFQQKKDSYTATK